MEYTRKVLQTRNFLGIFNHVEDGNFQRKKEDEIMFLKTINDILCNETVSYVSAGVVVFYLTFGMIPVAAFYDSWSDRKKLFFLCVIPFVLTFMSLSFKWGDNYIARCFGGIFVSLFIAPVFMGIHKHIND